MPVTPWYMDSVKHILTELHRYESPLIEQEHLVHRPPLSLHATSCLIARSLAATALTLSQLLRLSSNLLAVYHVTQTPACCVLLPLQISCSKSSVTERDKDLIGEWERRDNEQRQGADEGAEK